MASSRENDNINHDTNADDEEDDELYFLCPWKKKPNSVQILPNQTGQPGRWTQLDISNVKLRFLSPAIALFSNLTELYLNNNQLSSLPSVFFRSLTNLKHLDLSSNLFTLLPEEISNLINLRVLNIQNNLINELPLSMGKLFRLEKLLLDIPLIVQPPQEVVQQGTQAIVSYLREKMPVGEPPPPREWIYADSVSSSPHNASSFDNSKLPGALRVLCYNILAESYASPERAMNCPLWALNWEYRKHRILAELLFYDPDILCLQEVESEQYQTYFEPELQARGYGGVFRPKSRARTMSDCSKVDGCAVFYKHDLFELVEETLFEYQTIALHKHDILTVNKNDAGFNRLISKDNIALCLLLQPLTSSTSPPFNNGEKLLVVNTHIHWDPEFCDVKLMQTQFLLEQLEALATRYSTLTEHPDNNNNNPHSLQKELVDGERNMSKKEQDSESEARKKKWSRLAMLVCGDFNSLPGSGVYQLLETRHVEGTHPDFGTYDYGLYNTHGLTHHLELKSAYAECGGEPPFTNFTQDFVGVLDYIWYTPQSIRVHKVLRGVDFDVVLKSYGALPNPFMCSDHIPLVVDVLPVNPPSPTPPTPPPPSQHPHPHPTPTPTPTSLHPPLPPTSLPVPYRQHQQQQQQSLLPSPPPPHVSVPPSVSSLPVPLNHVHFNINHHVSPAVLPPLPYPHHPSPHYSIPISSLSSVPSVPFYAASDHYINTNLPQTSPRREKIVENHTSSAMPTIHYNPDDGINASDFHPL